MRVSRRPVCRVTPTGIVIELEVRRFIARQVVLEISFVEIGELRRLTYIEAACDPAIGTNVCKGSVVRPAVLHFVHGAGATLLMRGRDFFYAITCDRAEAEAVVSAYAWFKSRVSRPPRAAAALP